MVISLPLFCFLSVANCIETASGVDASGIRLGRYCTHGLSLRLYESASMLYNECQGRGSRSEGA